MTAYDLLMAIALVSLIVFAIGGLTGTSPSKLWMRAKGIDPYAGNGKDGRANDGDIGAGGGDSAGGD